MAALLGTWVDATPFRAHLRFLMAIGDLSVAEVAALCGIPSTSAEHLLDGRRGRTVRRISPETAHRLISVSDADVRGLRWRLMPADRARVQLARLRRAGYTDLEIAGRTGLTLVEMSRLSESRHCSELLTVRLLATARSADSRLSARRRTGELPAAA